jgi:hypothetical protein
MLSFEYDSGILQKQTSYKVAYLSFVFSHRAEQMPSQLVPIVV